MANHDDDSQDLVSLLSPDERAELTLLIATATEKMRHALDTASNPVPEKQPQKLKKEKKDTAETQESEKSEEKSKKKEPAASNQEAKSDTKEQLPSPRLTKVKQAALKSFDDWREHVLERIGEVVNSPSTAKDQARSSTSKPTSETAEPAEDEFLTKTFPPIPTPLRSVLHKRQGAPLVIQAVLLLLLSLERYDARSRVLMLWLTSSLGCSLNLLVEQENSTAESLVKAAELNADAESKKRVEGSSMAKKLKIGAASVAGAALIGITGGLAAPLLAAGIGTVMSGIGLGATAAAGYLGAVAGSSAIVGALFGGYGAKMTGEMVQRYSAEVEDFKFIPLREKEGNRLRVAVAITGWLVEGESEITAPYKFLGGGLEPYALRWETKALLDLGCALQTILTNTAWGYLKKELISHTVFSALYSAALWPVGLLKAARVIDNPFSIAKHRSEKAGLVLADAIINKAQGERPLTLIGFSLGARVIYSCLLSLAERNAYGLIENVILLGAPTPASQEDWQVLRSVTSGRLVNVFSESDYILGFLYRSSSVQLGVAGLQNIDVEGAENINAGEMVKGHLKYRHAVGPLLGDIMVGDVDSVEVGAEEKELEELEKMEKDKEAETEAGEDEMEKNIQKAEDELKKREVQRKET